MLVLAAALSLVIGLTLGLLGGGGSILTVPILIYALGEEPKRAIATSLLVVGITSAVAAAQHARAGNVLWRVALLFAGGGMVGAFAGGSLAQRVPARALLVLFAMIMYGAAAAMWRGRRGGAASGPVARLPVLRILGQGAAVGAVTGMVGAGGGFLVVPALALLAGLPMPQAVGSSLAVIALQSLAGFLGHVRHVELDYGLAAVVTGAAVVGSFGGAALSGRVRPEVLRRGFAGFVAVMATYLLAKQIF
jgi:uncharacterized membrane protein YfcA